MFLNKNSLDLFNQPLPYIKKTKQTNQPFMVNVADLQNQY